MRGNGPRPAAGPSPSPRAPAAPDVVALLRYLRTTPFGPAAYASEDELAEAVGRYLAAVGFLPVATEVEIRDVAPPRPERLDPAIAFHSDTGGHRAPWS